MRHHTDFVVIGTGIAGLTYALKVADKAKVLLLSKSKIDDTATKYAQGGIAAVLYKPDSIKKHLNDTINAGGGLCKPEIVEMVAKEGPERIKELVNWGTHFDKKTNGHFDLAKEGGHTEHRILHHKDNTGYEIQKTLTEKVKNHPNIKILDKYFVLDIITQHHLGKLVKRCHKDIKCYGVYSLNTKNNNVETILSKLTFIATGGIGNVYNTTTNPLIATGDGIALTYRAKGIIENMEFVQFHPTSLFNPKENPSFLITEALRGFGAVLKTKDGKDFMHKYEKRGSLAPRDIVARAIDTEMKNLGDEYVYLDATITDKEKLKKNFPNIYKKCLSLNIDITKDMIPVVPAAHYICGGIKVDKNGSTSIKNLYAAGEVTSTGLHGANRLASNSLTEGVVFAHNAAEKSKNIIDDIEFEKKIPEWNDEGTSLPEEMVLITQSQKEMKQIMSNYVGIVRSNLRLKRALDRLEIIYNETETLYDKSTVSVELCELRNSINVAYLVIKMAQNRKESRGLHYNIDYPFRNNSVR